MDIKTEFEPEAETGNEQESPDICNGHAVELSAQLSARTEDLTDELDAAAAGENQSNGTGERPRRRGSKRRIVAFGVLPGLAFVLTLSGAFLKWQDASVRDAGDARTGSVQSAKDSTVAILSYRSDTVEKDLGAARDRLTGTFRDSYSALIRDVVIPGAEQRQISTVATTPAAASVSADPDHAVVIVFVNQATTMGTDAPTDTASTVRVALDKVDGRWLVSKFDPI